MIALAVSRNSTLTRCISTKKNKRESRRRWEGRHLPLSPPQKKFSVSSTVLSPSPGALLLAAAADCSPLPIRPARQKGSLVYSESNNDKTMTARCNILTLYLMTRCVVCVSVWYCWREAGICFFYGGRFSSYRPRPPETVSIRTNTALSRETKLTFLRRSVNSMEDIGRYSDTHPHTPTHFYVFTDHEP